jgi:hypothetical protein
MGKDSISLIPMPAAVVVVEKVFPYKVEYKPHYFYIPLQYCNGIFFGPEETQ